MRGLLLISGPLLLAGGSYLSPPRVPLHERGRDLVRPLILPMVWKGLESAQRDGTPEEYVARGRVLMKLVPRWTDGHVHMAGQLAFEASLAQRDEGAALDRLMAALAYLDEVRAGIEDAAAIETILENQARFLYVRCSQDPVLAKGFHRRTGVSPTVWATGYLRKIPRLEGSAFLKTALCFSLIAGLVIDIRLKEPVDRLLASLDTAVLLLDELRDKDLAEKWRASLQKVRNYLTGRDEELYSRMKSDPRLGDFLEAFETPTRQRK